MARPQRPQQRGDDQTREVGDGQPLGTVKEQRRHEGRDQREDAHLHEALQRGGQAAHLREDAEHLHRHAGHGQGHAQGVDAQRNDGPRNLRRGHRGVDDAGEGGAQHQHEADESQAVGRHLAGQPARGAGAAQHAQCHGDEHPGEAGFRQAQDVDDVGCGRADVDGHADEDQGNAQHAQDEHAVEQHLAIVAHDAAELQRRALRLGQRLGNAQLPEEPQHKAVAGEHDEHRMPAKGGLQPAADDGRE